MNIQPINNTANFEAKGKFITKEISGQLKDGSTAVIKLLKMKKIF